MKDQIAPSIVIIHFQPLELYPPVCNLLHYLAQNSIYRIIVITTENKKDKKLRSYENNSKQVIIKRTSAIVSNSPIRLFRYFFFYLHSLKLLLNNAPQSVLYFDTISSWPALMYKKIKGSKVKLLAHYHEYCSRVEYAGNMILTKAMHQQEVKMYSQSYLWISQTNEVRLEKMIADNQLQNADKSVFHTMPNFPSKYWAKSKTNYGISKKIRLVYVGSLGYKTTYLYKLTEWVIKNKNHFSLDLYSHNIDEMARAFLASVQECSVQLHEAVNYNELPGLLSNYDVGLVIYKPVSDNWIHNAPNKLFEYLACGLDVWFSKTMTYASIFAKEDTFPKIIPVDFQNLDEFDFEKAVNREGLLYRETDFFYENIYPEILAVISK